MDLIQQFIDTYKMKWTFYDAAGRLAAEKLQLALQNAGIRAIVTSRAKNPARLRTKVQRRNSRREEPYQTLEEIYDDIADLSGVRVSLYFPGDRGKVDAIISELFNILEFKQFPEQSKPPTYHKRFSGYWANHYRARMRDEILNESQKKYGSARIEIQVASLIMHAWSEVEHDLIGVVLHRKHKAAPVQICREPDLGFVRQRHEHAKDPSDNLAQVHHLMVADRLRVRLAERQQLLRHARQPI